MTQQSLRAADYEKLTKIVNDLKRNLVHEFENSKSGTFSMLRAKDDLEKLFATALSQYKQELLGKIEAEKQYSPREDHSPDDFASGYAMGHDIALDIVKQLISEEETE